MMPPIKIDTILSDPLLMVAAVLLVVSPVVFLVALIKFLRAPKGPSKFAIPHEDDFTSPVRSLAAPEKPEEPIAPPPPPPAPKVETPAPASPPPAPPAPAAVNPDATMVLPAGVAELQAQLEIALTQIRTLNKKIFDLESAVSALVRSGPASGTASGLTPDVASKLQTIAEHVIVLEKEVARLKSVPDVPGPERRPPMPL